MLNCLERSWKWTHQDPFVVNILIAIEPGTFRNITFATAQHLLNYPQFFVGFCSYMTVTVIYDCFFSLVFGFVQSVQSLPFQFWKLNSEFITWHVHQDHPIYTESVESPRRCAASGSLSWWCNSDLTTDDIMARSGLLTTVVPPGPRGTECPKP